MASFSATSAHAVIVYDFNQYFDGPVVPDGPAPWARLTISTINPGNVHFRLDNLTPASEANKIKDLWLNVDPVPAMMALTNTGGFPTNTFAYGLNSQNGPQGSKWDIKIGYATGGAAFIGGLFSEWTISGTGLTEDSFYAFAQGTTNPSLPAMIHFLSAGPNNDSSHVVAVRRFDPPGGDPPAIPGPVAFAPFAAGFLSILRRRHSRA